MQKEDEEDKELLNLITEPTYFNNDDDNESLELSLQQYKDNNKIPDDKPVFNLLPKNNNNNNNNNDNKFILPKINNMKMRSIDKKISMSENENESKKLNKSIKGINRLNNIRYTTFNQLLENITKNHKSNFKTVDINNEGNKKINFKSIEILPSIK